MKIVLVTTDNREQYKDYSSPAPYFGTAPSALLKGFEDLEGIEVHVVSCLRQRVRAPKQIGRNIYYHSLVVPKVGWIRTFYLGCIRAVRVKLDAIQPDIVHGQGTERDCAMSAVFSRHPNVVTIHGNMVEVAKAFGAGLFSFHWWAAKLETSALKRTLGVFCNSAHTERLVAPRARRTWRVPNALQPEYFVSVPPPRKTGSVVLLHVGTINQNKQQIKVLELAKEMHRRGKRFRIDFIGEPNNSPYAQAFFKQIREAQQLGFARYVGKLGTSELIKAYDAAHALIHTPKSEAFGLVVAEALARNTKVFAFWSGGVGDILHGVDGAVLCPTDDWQALEEQVCLWLTNPAENQLATADLMSSRYHPQSIAQRHIEIYKEILKSRGSCAN